MGIAGGFENRLYASASSIYGLNILRQNGTRRQARPLGFPQDRHVDVWAFWSRSADNQQSGDSGSAPRFEYCFDAPEAASGHSLVPCKGLCCLLELNCTETVLFAIYLGGESVRPSKGQKRQR
jgi:hypothetical protein